MGNIGKLFVVAKREYMERIRSRWFIVMTLLVPAIFSGAMLFPVYVAARSSASGGALRNIAILDASGTGLGEQIATTLKTDTTLGRPDGIEPRVIVATTAELPAKERELQTQVEQPNSLVGYLVLTDSTLTNNVASYSGRNASTINDIDKLRTIVRQDVMIARLQREGVRADVVKDLATATFRLKSERITERGRSGSGTGGFLAGIIVGVLLFMSIVFHGQNVLRGVLEEKSTRVAEVVISSVKPEVLLAGKVLGVGGVGLTQQAAWLGITAYLMSFVTPILTKGLSGQAAAAAADQFGGGFATISLATIGLVLVYFIIGFVFYASLYAAAGSMVNSEQEAQQAAAPVLILLMSTWLLVNTVLVNPNSKLAVALSWLPWSSPIIVPLRVGLTTVSPITIAGSIVVAILGCIGAVWLSARIYRVGMLMYGKKPSFAEVARWIRYA
ncbi:MAG TPA: ABC transporter permease [Gemmatimonadaceae bacterium]|jgi:ABC-2 type transport system permease protein|nr:ABC transporter permease [Gemmatimonadaceae bacterium]